MQSTYITALERQISVASKPGYPRTTGNPDSMVTILELQKRISTLNDELVEERIESKRSSKESRDLTTLLHEKERLLLETGELLKEVESRMGESVSSQASLLSKNELLLKAKVQGEEKALFRIRELELRLEKVNAVDARLRKEDNDVSVLPKGVPSAVSDAATSRTNLNDEIVTT